MIKNNIKNILIRIADQLDRRGQSDLADQLDQEVISILNETNFKKAEIEKEIKELELLIPEEERSMIEEVLKALQDSLK